MKSKLVASEKKIFTFSFYLFILVLNFSIGFAQTTKLIRTEEIVENDIQNFISTHLNTYEVNPYKIKQMKENQEKEKNNTEISKSDFDNTLLDIKKYDLRKIYFENHPEDLKLFTSKLTSGNSALQTCNDGNFENWPAANPFVFKLGGSLNTGNLPGLNIITTGSDFVPFLVGNTTNNFTSLATLVTTGADPTVPAVSRVLNGNQAIKLNFPETSSTYGREIVTMSRSFVVNENNFDFNYSVILNDSGIDGSHPTIDSKPYFLVRIYDASQTNILRQISVLANPGDCSFMSTTGSNLDGPILYSGWQCARIDLTGLLNQTVIVEFIVSDCIIGGHLGTVYIDDICNSNCSNPMFGIINLNPIQTIICPTVNQNICGTFQSPSNSVYSDIHLNILQNGVLVNTIATPSSLTASTFCFTVPPSAFGTNPTGNFEFQVVGVFTRQCTINFQLNPIFDNSANDNGPDVTFITPQTVPTFNQIAPICSGTTFPILQLPTSSLNGITGAWSPSLDNTTTKLYTFTPTSGSCATTATMTIIVNANTVPTFNQVDSICIGGTLSNLPSTSLNGIVGTWSPGLDNTVTKTYTFAPTSGQCITNATMTITVKQIIAPIFTPFAAICKGSTAPTLALTSNNGITGTWNPSTINTSTTGSFIYTFTPLANQCANVTTMPITIKSYVTPLFTQVPPICQGATLDPITISPTNLNYEPNGYWTPAAMNNMSTTTYTYHAIPSAGQCINDTTMTIVIENLQAVNDFFTGTPINILTGGLTASVLNNDLYNGSSLQSSGILYDLTILNITATPSIGIIPAFSFDANGNIVVPPGTPQGTYAIAYQIQSRICIPFIKSTATATLIVNFTDIITPIITPGIRANSVVSLVDTQSNGQIIIAGAFTTYNNINCNQIARLSTALTYDPSFNVTGSTPAGSYPYALKVIKNSGSHYNKILLGGGFIGWSGSTNGIGIALLNTDGTIDYDFNSGPLASLTSNRGVTNQYATTFTGGVINAIYIYPDGAPNAGKILIGGYFNTYNGYPANGLALLNADGSYDTSSGFNTNINTIINTGLLQSTKGFNSTVGSIIVDSNNRIIVAGSFNWYNGVPKNGILRLKDNGILDDTYNKAYESLLAPNPGFSANVVAVGRSGDFAKKLVLQPDGKLIVGGSFVKYNNFAANNIVRINVDGSLDTTFATGTGFNNNTLNPNTGEPGIVRDLILDTTTNSNLLLYVAGDFTSYKGTLCDEVIRIKCSVTPGNRDTNFGLLGGGPNGTSNGTVWCMKQQSGDGKIIIGGKFTTYGLGSSALNITRIFPTSASGEAKSETNYYDSEPEIDLFVANEIIIYPNPNDGIFNIKLNEEYSKNTTIKIYDIMGNRIYEKNNLNENDYKINISNFEKGTYFVSLSNENNSSTITKTIIIK